MKIKDGFVIREVMGNFVVIATGEVSRDFHGMVKLNETAAEIWGYVAEGKELDAIVAEMLSKYDVDEAKLRADIESTLETFKKQGFIESRPKKASKKYSKTTACTSVRRAESACTPCFATAETRLSSRPRRKD